MENNNKQSGIIIKDLSKIFNDNNKALDNVSIHFKPNTTTGLIGFNGSGKTTTFNIIAGFMEKTKGSILIDGKKPAQDIWKQISYLAAGAEPKNPTKVISHLKVIADLYGMEKAAMNKTIKDISKNMDFTQFLDKPIKSLSKGNQQKVKIIASFLNPKMKYLFLDEPFDGLDPIMVSKVVKLYEAIKGVTIIITSHRMEVVQEMTEEFYVLKDGKLVDSKRTDDPTIFVEVNKEVSMTSISKLKYVKSVKDSGDFWEITADNVKNFKDLNMRLIKLPKYEWSSLKAKNIAESVFKQYVAEGRGK